MSFDFPCFQKPVLFVQQKRWEKPKYCSLICKGSVSHRTGGEAALRGRARPVI